VTLRNNYGIALLDALQYDASVHAFEHVASLRPDDADAYSNLAIVEISWERYNDAKPHLAKALSLLPGDPRALYYRALSSNATPDGSVSEKKQRAAIESAKFADQKRRPHCQHIRPRIPAQAS
jgi:tetratricopeptide (TPR) repeat protein